jgi:hypothetical protein
MQPGSMYAIYYHVRYAKLKLDIIQYLLTPGSIQSNYSMKCPLQATSTYEQFWHN